ncbi:trypsin-like serine peptidase [Streptomyces sp. bgisy100]|uniref:trypsin-like serine peptidase n=1 Tax=Streptomyces sp. bgisy100 TaxID=3413783 RepID=UPI003D74F7A1
MHVRRTFGALAGGAALALLPLTPAQAEPAEPPVPVPAPAPPVPVPAPAGADARASAHPDAPASALPDARASAHADAYWTSARMRAARPVAEDRQLNGAAPARTSKAGGQRAARSPGKPFEGLPMTGTFFWQDGTDTGRFCSGSVVTSPGKNLVMSAGHCFDGKEARRNLTFVPQYNNGAKPHGAFAVDPGRIYVDKRYLSKGPDKAADLDFAFLRLEPRAGKNVQDVVGSVDLMTDPGYAHDPVRLTGYPANRTGPLDCWDRTTRYDSTDPKIPGSFLRIECDGYSGGTSGGPFLVRKGEGWGLIGVIGGWKTGGDKADVSYGSYLDADARALYEAAVAGKPPAGRGVLGTAGTWKHADVLAGGHFAGGNPGGEDYADLLVRWSDGELSIYRGSGDGAGTFDKEFRVLGPNGTWKNAVSVTAGDFTGTGRDDDLLVRWVDGEVTLYPDVDEKGLHGEVQLQKPGARWKHAASITAGRYTTTDDRANDLLVRWSDGTVTLFTDVDRQGFHEEKKLSPPSGTWKNAATLTSGDFTGTGQHDLMVRWTDGELTLYPDLDQDGFHGEKQLRAPGEPWKQATVLAAGDYTGNHRPDDILIRWSDGALTLHPDAGESGGSRDLVLVPHPAA